MKTTTYALSTLWDSLLESTLSQMLQQIPQCNDLKSLIKITNSLAKTIHTFAIPATPQLQAAQRRMETLIAECTQIKLIISATRSIARVVKTIDPGWQPLLTICCDRLQTLMQQNNDLDEIIRTVNCIAHLAPLVAEPVDMTSDTDESNGSAPLKQTNPTAPLKKYGDIHSCTAATQIAGHTKQQNPFWSGGF